MKNIISLFIGLAGFLTLSSQTAEEVLIYWDDPQKSIFVRDSGSTGAWIGSVVSFEAFFDLIGIDNRRISPEEINRYPDLPEAKIFIMPGGNADFYDRNISNKGIQWIKDFVNRGGIYLGTGGGADWACTEYYWYGELIDYQLDLVEATAIGPIPEIIPWPNYTMAEISWNEEFRAFDTGLSRSYVLYSGGCYFIENSSKRIEIVASYAKTQHNAAVVYSKVGHGQVLLWGVYPEVEENSMRDNNALAGEIIDPESEWPLLLELINWMGVHTKLSPEDIR